MVATPEPAASSESILRFLRVTLHVAFAVLLAVGAIRMLGSELPQIAKIGLLALTVVLAAAYLSGTVAEKRLATGTGKGTSNRLANNLNRYAFLWLGLVTGLWILLLIGSREYAWVAFPLFFLHLHLLPKGWGLLAVVLLTAAIVLSQFGVAGPGLPVILGPIFGAAFAVVTSKAYTLLYQEGQKQRLAADQLRATRSELAATQHEAGVLAERARLAREIHDTLAQGFSSIVLVSRAAQKALDDADSHAARQSLELIGATAAENLAEARNFVRDLSSPALQGSSLIESLNRLCESTQQEAATRSETLRCVLRVDGEVIDLPKPYEVTILRAAQASLANVRAHAKASNAVVSLSFLESEVTLDVFDDGIGFDPQTAKERGGFGLTALAQRVAEQRGSLNIESTVGEGTVIAVRMPLGDPQLDDAQLDELSQEAKSERD